MGDGLPDFEVDAFYGAEAGTHIGQELFAAPLVEDKRRFYLRGVHAESVFVEFGATGFAGHGLYLGNFEQYLFGHAPYLVRLFERDAGQGAYVDGEGAFVERRQEAAAQGGV